jgi:small-conductance mechanosensitive channel
MEQMIFVWANYPSHSACPHLILDWLVVEARRIAYEEQAAKQMEQELYGSGPQNRTSNNNNNEYYEGD